MKTTAVEDNLNGRQPQWKMTFKQRNIAKYLVSTLTTLLMFNNLALSIDVTHVIVILYLSR